MLLMLVSILVIAPMLAYMSTGLKVGKEVYEEKMYLFYAADSGIELGLWQIKYEKLNSFFDDYDPYAYFDHSSSYRWDYPLPKDVNGKDVIISVENVWIPQGYIDAPSPSEARGIIEGTGGEPAKLIIAGSIIEKFYQDSKHHIKYKININYNGEYPESLKVETIGIWLPVGFVYEGNCSLADDPDTEPYSAAEVDDYCGGKAVLWDFASSVLLEDFPGGTGYAMERSFTFQFGTENESLEAEGKNAEAALSWINTTGLEGSGIDYTWDGDVRVYRLTSTATDADTGKQTFIETYTTRIEPRKIGSGLSGDYCAVGGTLLEATGSGEYRDRLYMQSSTTITDDDIPANATVQAAYLYWSGWIDYHCKEKPQLGQWRWKDIPELRYPDNPTPESLTELVETAAKVNRVTLLFGSGSPVTITVTNTPPLSEWQVKENEDQTWSYSCFYDATDLVKQLVVDEELGPNGSGTYRVQHVPEDRPGYSGESPNYSFEFQDTTGDTGYPLGTPADELPSYWGEKRRPSGKWAYAGWSLIIIYASPETKGHQLYLYDDFAYAAENSNVDFDGDGDPGGTIGGFLAPQEIMSEDYAAHLTCFVGEGDEEYSGDYIKVNGTSLSNMQSPTHNVWNSKSPGLAESGVDIDTFTVAYPTIEPGYTSAQVDLPTQTDSWNLVYIILSFRSKVTTGGAISYLVKQ